MKNLLACIGLLAIAGLLFALAATTEPEPKPKPATPTVNWLMPAGEPLEPRPVRYEHR